MEQYLDIPDSYGRYRIFKLFNLTHPDQIEELPATFVDYAMHYDQLERKLENEANADVRSNDV